MNTKNYAFGLVLMGASMVTWAADATPHSPYAGQEGRKIKSLSASDVEALTQGKGWGLAKPAELNGVPGPAHILELKEQLELTAQQESTIQALWQDMNQQAQTYGARYLQSEAKIEQFFAQGQTDQDVLSQLLDESASSLAKLRSVHLQAHIAAKPVLTYHQNMLYQKLRGYNADGGHSGHHHHH
ncbi:MAG: hypothetical protein ACPGPF_01135 [Pontibacterium sp.]